MKAAFSVVVVGLMGLVLACASACGGGTTSSPGGNPDATNGDTLPGADADFAGQPELPTQPDSGGDDGFVRADMEIVEGGIGWPCRTNADCTSGWCIQTADGQVCTVTCVEECLQGWECRGLTSTKPDMIYICVPMFVHLCDPCATNADCAGEFESLADRCIDRGPDGKFCGGDCSAGGVCPPGYACETIEGEVRQCVPEGGAVCTCSRRATTLELQTACFTENDFGSCAGVRRCGQEGVLTDCSAVTPAEDVCDGRDNDCDGLTDNLDSTDCPITNQFGTCQGTGTCVDGQMRCEGPQPAGEACDGVDNDCDDSTDEGFANTDGDPWADCLDTDDDNDDIIDDNDNCPIVANADQADFDGDNEGDACDADDDDDGAPDAEDCAPLDPQRSPYFLEQCDNIDNDCNLEIDDGLCEDGNPCTGDICDPAGGCEHPHLDGVPCDDGNVCTQYDICQAGLCAGGSPQNCDDLNACTTDLCDPGTGCYSVNNTAPCEDGNFCTDGDRCSNGVCMSGPSRTCNDNNGCTADSCVPASGCVYDPAPFNGTPCDDGDPCLLGDTCGGGSCNAGPIKYCDESECQGGLYIGTCVIVFGSPTCIGYCATPPA